MRKGDYYKNLFEYFEEADRVYNSGLFDFKKDELSKYLKIENSVLENIINELYYPESPYEFSVLSVEILGSAYEQFLGKVIRLTPSHKAKIEEKPEVRKAGGVYYTPQYIVDYIVKNTVGKLVEGKTPKEVEKLKIVDPACGSGSFLIGAYQYLLDWHLSYYMGKGAKEKALSPDGRLTTAVKKKILINNIYGVDIDTQATEVTKLSLLLKCMEGETQASVQQTMGFVKERVLPMLDNNIKCGNSLIDTDFYDGELEFAGTDRKIKPFNWQNAFPEVFKQGGFDCVIGNPPYGAYLEDNVKQYLSENYKFVADYETSQYFLARGENLLKNNGYLSFIIPNTTFLNVLAKKFREFVLHHYVLLSLTDLSSINVFEGATVRTSIPFLKKGIDKNSDIIFQKFVDTNLIEIITKLKTDNLRKNDELWNSSFSDKSSINIKNSIDAKSILLSDILDISQGLIPYDKYRGHDEYTIKNRIWNADYKKNNTYKKELRGGDVKRYEVKWNGNQWISYGKWLAAPRKPEYFTKPRLLFREITDPKTGLLHVGYTDKEFYNNPGIINGILLDKKYSLFYLLGIVNSKLIAYLHFAFSPKAKKGVFPKILVNDVRNIRIPKIDFTNPAEKQKHDEMVKLVDKMLELHRELQKVKLPGEKESLQQRIDHTDRRIDKLVYELYELTEEEIKVVEGVNDIL